MGKVPLPDRLPTIRPVVLGPILLVVALAAGCGSATGQGPSGTTTSVPPVPPPGAMHLTEADNGRSVTVARGTTVQLVLGSTYWTVAPLPDGSVLRAAGAPVVAPAIGHCVAGQGCGTVTSTWIAVAPGSVTVTAGRTVCGEALACGPQQRSFRVVVTVG